MAVHYSGNSTWIDYPNTTTPISALALENVENLLDKISRGIVARRVRTTNGTATTATTAATAQPFMRVTGSVVAGRAYKVGVLMSMYSTNALQGIGQLTYTLDGSTASVGSTQLALVLSPALPTSAAYVPVQEQVLFTPASSGTLSLLFSYYAQNTGTINAPCTATLPAVLTVEDAGLDPGNSGADL